MAQPIDKVKYCAVICSLHLKRNNAAAIHAELVKVMATMHHHMTLWLGGADAFSVVKQV